MGAYLNMLNSNAAPAGQIANENFARELMERFTMGAGNYTQEDVVQSARCFTGWELDNVSGEYFFNPYDNDDGIKFWSTVLDGDPCTVKLIVHEVVQRCHDELEAEGH